jgi:ankyrin repeat protein
VPTDEFFCFICGAYMKVNDFPIQSANQVNYSHNDEAYRLVYAQLFKAIASDSLDLLDAFWHEHGDFDFLNTWQEPLPALHAAVMRCSKAFLESLLSHVALCPALYGDTPFSEDSLLTIACVHRDASIVKVLLDAGVDVNDGGKGVGRSPLFLVARKDEIEKLTLLVEAGADLDVLDDEHRTVLICAVDAGSNEAVKFLLNRGVSMAHSGGGGALLSLAASWGHVDVLKTLISFGAQVNSKDPVSGFTPLMRAAGTSNSLEVARVLLDHDPNAIFDKDYRGYTALMMAAELGYVDMLKELAMCPEVNIDETSYSQLIVPDAQLGRYQETLQFFTTYDPERGRYWYRETALMAAVRAGNSNAVNALLDLNADVNAFNEQGYSVLMLAVESGMPELVAMLYSRGASTAWTSLDGFNVLSLAVHTGSCRMVEMVIALGVDVNRPLDQNDCTPFMLAVSNGADHLIPIFHRAGTDLDGLNRAGCTALTIAVRSGDMDCVSKLLELGANPDVAAYFGARPLVAAIQEDDIEIVIALVNAGAEVNATDAMGFTALMAAARRGETQIVQCLLNAGANVHAATQEGLTAKGYAARAGEEDVVNLLSSYGDGASLSKRRQGK